MQRPVRRRRLLGAFVAIGLVVAALLGAAYLGAAALVYDTATHVDPDCGGRWPDHTPASWSPPRWASEPDVAFDPTPYLVSDYEDVRILGRDAGIELHAWWLPSPDGPTAPAVVVVHGLRDCVRHPESLAPAGMLHRRGYSVLMVELRDHGDSSIEDGRHAGGTEEYRDVLAAVDWLVEQGATPGRIGVLGTSLGAATAIIAGGQDDRIAAVWSDSAYVDTERRIREELDARGYPAILAPATTLMAQLISGDDLQAHTVLGEVPNLSGRRLAVLHGVLDESTYVEHAYDLIAAARAAGVEVESWIAPEAGHVQTMFRWPAQYEQRLDDFFGGAFGQAAT
jgi:dipeptidyl aminopeptidase/acylaminoacyl peptidase